MMPYSKQYTPSQKNPVICFLLTECFLPYIPLLKSFLSMQEQKYAELFKMPQKKNEFIISRAILRILLGNLLSINPYDLIIYYSEHGKPYLSKKQNPHYIQFNVSHSHNAIMLGFTVNYQIGVDIECVSSREIVSNLIDYVYSPCEVKHYNNISYTQQQLFYLWNRKEAVAKAIGCGLNMQFSNFSVINSQVDVPCFRLNLHLSTIVPFKNYFASVAVTGPPYKNLNLLCCANFHEFFTTQHALEKLLP